MNKPVNKIEELIAELCPEGVEIKELGECASIKRGKRVTKNELNPEKKYPVYSGGVTPMGYFEKYNQLANTITVVKYGTAGFVNFIKENFWANDVCYCIVPSNVIDNKYLFYVLKSKQDFIQSQATNAIPAHLPTEAIEKIAIPLPPLSIQQEIVKILDTFTTLEAELEAELEARKKQYEYYRDELLTFGEDVEFKELWEVTAWDKRFNGVDREKQTKVLSFKHISANELKKLETREGSVKLLATGKFDGWTTEELAGTNINRGEVISIPSGGSASLKYYKGKFVDSGNLLASSFNNEILNLKYCYYFLLIKNELIESYFRGAGVKHPNMSEILKIKIPLPPIPIQQEIVKILDTFTTLEAELEAELATRKKQYVYYRDELLRFGDEVEFKELGEIVEILDSQRKLVSKSQRTGGEYPYYGANGIQDYVNDYIFDGAFILLGEAGSVINKDGSPVLNWASGKIWVNTHAHILAEKSEIAILRYVYFALSVIDVTKVVKGNIPEITQQSLRNFLIPIPPLAEQERIVAILDKFDALVNDISVGLPAELNARRKQYEYYRDKLLTFKPLENEYAKQ